jgi:hypothetical protein
LTQPGDDLSGIGLTSLELRPERGEALAPAGKGN